MLYSRVRPSPVMPVSQDYYDLLGIKRDAAESEIRKAYRRLARQYHPDMNKSPEAEKKFAEISEAHDVLSDPDKRRAYDRFGQAGVGARHGAPGYGPGPGGFQQTWSTSGPGAEPDMESIFEQMLGGRTGGGSPFGYSGFGGPGSPAAQAQPRPTKGADLHHRLAVSFMTAAKGGDEHIRLNTGAGTQTITVRIPPGMDDAGKLRVKGKGQTSPNGGPDGDLIITVSVGRHPLFRREKLDLLLDVPVTIVEATAGVTIHMPLLTGSVDMKIPPGASSGRKLRIKGKGIEDGKGRVGDFYAVVQIVVPEELSEAGHEHLRQLADELKNPRESGPWADLT